jgi:hypothetical protein
MSSTGAASPRSGSRTVNRRRRRSAVSRASSVATIAASSRTPRFQRYGATTRSAVSGRVPATMTTVRRSGRSTTMACPRPTSSTVTRSRSSGGRIMGQAAVTIPASTSQNAHARATWLTAGRSSRAVQASSAAARPIVYATIAVQCGAGR